MRSRRQPPTRTGFPARSSDVPGHWHAEVVEAAQARGGPIRVLVLSHQLATAQQCLGALARGSKNYLQALFAVTLDGEASSHETRRFVVQLVVVDAAGILRAIDPPADVIDAVAAMVEGDRRAGSTAWRKLTARITPKADGGATLHVDVL